jgi:SnoaL-like domain
MRTYVAGSAGLALSAAILVAGCGGRDQPDPVLKENELIARLLMADFESGDVSELSRLFYPGAVYDDFADERQYRGLGEISSYVASLQEWVGQIVMSVTEVHPWDKGAVVEWVLSGVQDKPIPGRVTVVTGHDVTVSGITLLEIDNHRITRAADYLDALPLMLQLGGELHMPGGLVLRNDSASVPDSSGSER